MNEPLDLEFLKRCLVNLKEAEEAAQGLYYVSDANLPELADKILAFVDEVKRLKEDYKVGIAIQNMINHILTNSGGKISDYVILCDGINVSLMRKEDYQSNS